MTRAAIIILCLLTISCNPQKKLNRLLMKYPELRDTVIIHDTVEAVVEYVRADTVVRWRNGDTIYLSKDRLRVRTVVNHDTIWQRGECLSDTVFVPVRYEVPVVQPTKTVQHIPWWVWVMLGLSFVTVMLNSLRK